MNNTAWYGQQTTIGHLRIWYAESVDGLSIPALRTRVERFLGNADVNPPGLGSGAVLIVRKLRSPVLSGVSALSHSAPATWRVAIHDQIATLHANAVRPALSQVPSDAASVLFADQSELLVCLTRDLLNDRVQDHWYWQLLLRNVAYQPSSAFVTLWCEHATVVPALFSALHPAEIYQALSQLTSSAIRQIIHALHISFELPVQAHALYSPGVPSLSMETQHTMHNVSGDTLQATFATAESGEREPHKASISPSPPWEPWLPATTLPMLLSDARYLLGLGLTLYHAPTFARSTTFATRASRWLTEHEAKSREHLPDVYSSSVRDWQQVPEDGSIPETWQQPVEGALLVEAQSQKHEPILAQYEQIRAYEPDDHIQTSPAIPVNTEIALHREDRADPPPLQQEATPTLASQQGMSGSHEDTFLASSSLADSSPPEITQQREFVCSTAQPMPINGVPTRLGGILYLIHLLTWLNLPWSWDWDGTFAESMGGWAIVEALARGLLTSTQETYPDDPIWSMLAQLDQRVLGTPIARQDFTLEPDRPFRLPVSWLKRVHSGLWNACQQDQRLMLYDAVAGFLIADVPLYGHTFFEAAQAEVAAYVKQGLTVNWQIAPSWENIPYDMAPMGSFKGQGERHDLMSWLSAAAFWWLDHILSFVYALLSQVLKIEPERLVEVLLCCNGQLIVSRTHVDLHMSMEEIRIPVRCAGLDRDPGWVPDLARIIYFHFH